MFVKQCLIRIGNEILPAFISENTGEVFMPHSTLPKELVASADVLNVSTGCFDNIDVDQRLSFDDYNNPQYCFGDRSVSGDRNQVTITDSLDYRVGFLTRRNLPNTSGILRGEY